MNANFLNALNEQRHVNLLCNIHKQTQTIFQSLTHPMIRLHLIQLIKFYVDNSNRVDDLKELLHRLKLCLHLLTSLKKYQFHHILTSQVDPS